MAASKVPPCGPGYRALRRGRTALAGQVYSLTFTTCARARFFDQFEAARIASWALSCACARTRSRVLAWVLMPDHVHLLVELDADETPSLVVARAKSAMSRQLQGQHSERRQYWAPGFHDHALRREEGVLRAARYLVMNPVRAGLVKRVGDYPFWDCVWLGSRG